MLDLVHGASPVGFLRVRYGPSMVGPRSGRVGLGVGLKGAWVGSWVCLKHWLLVQKIAARFSWI